MGYFLISPLVHDYDFIQLIPIIDKQRNRQTVAVLASLPGWLTILFAYQNDSAWLTFSLIAPALLGCELLRVILSERDKPSRDD